MRKVFSFNSKKLPTHLNLWNFGKNEESCSLNVYIEEHETAQIEETEKTHPSSPVSRECLQPTETKDLVPVPNLPAAALEEYFNP